MKNLKYIFFLFSFLFVVISCGKDEVVVEPDPVDVTELENPINNFVWKAMNEWYNWQSSVPALADSKRNNIYEYYNYLNGYDTPEDLFKSLRYDYPNTDRFSWFIDDWEVQKQQFQGISKSFGFRLQAVVINDNDDIIFYVRYVVPGSPADNAGIKRGDIFNAIDGTELNQSNYSDLVSKLGNETISMSFVSENNGELNHIEDKSITAELITENPVHFHKIFSDINGKKVGYLVYNAFRTSYNDELNAVFAEFKNNGVDELVLDLRLNGGGSVQTSAYLGSMVNQAASSDVFAELRFNDKQSNQNGAYFFGNTMNIYNSGGDKIGEEAINRLNNLSRVYILSSGSTASASEMIINGLKPFMEVIVIGTQTYGKNVGSITLYDSPTSLYTNEDSANASHKNALQPIVFQIFNKNLESEYYQGFVPDIEVKEYYSWNEIKEFGNEEETVLKGALDHIRGISSRPVKPYKYEQMKAFDVFELENRFEKEMYIDTDFLMNK